jgi:hypothetical protein
MAANKIIFLCVYCLCVAAALFSIWKRPGTTARMRCLLSLLVLGLPVVGPLFYFFFSSMPRLHAPWEQSARSDFHVMTLTNPPPKDFPPQP